MFFCISNKSLRSLVVPMSLGMIIKGVFIKGLTGIFAHAIWSQHRRFMTDYCPTVAPFQNNAIATQPQPEPQEISRQPEAKQEADVVSKVTPSVELVKTVKKRGKTSSQMEAHQVKLQPMSVGAAAVNYNAMTSEQLRKECALQGINWRSGGDYARPMKKAQMLAALK